MSMDLYLWKAPVIDDADEAKRLVDLYFDQDDKSVFEPSADLQAMAEELLQLYPVRVVYGDEALAALSERDRRDYSEEAIAEIVAAGVYVEGENSPWADLPFYQSDRLLGLSIRWSAESAALDKIVELAAEHDLVIYDPQGPDVYPARDAPEPQPDERATVKDVLGVVLGLFLPFVGATLAIWWFVPWGWLRWPLVAVGVFLSISAGIVVYAMVASLMGKLDEEPAR